MTNHYLKAIMVTSLSLLALGAASSGPAEPAQDAAPELKTPINGWRPKVEKGGQFTQQVNYPAASVNTPAGQADTARIRGAIAATPKNTAGPATLVVNGVAMPLSSNPDGSFDRPYIFTSGSNSLEARAPSGASKRVQFYQQAGNETRPQLRIVLSWDSDNTDLDLHVITPDGEHAWYGNRVLSNGGAQDMDVTTGFGPEIFASPSPLPGQYLVYVNYYGGSTGEDAQPITSARVTLITHEGTADEKIETTLVPMRAAGELNFVKRFSYP
ncbi:MAG TPA: DUF2135 domain-containing protein [Cellvibrionaceae bacterium]|nr:DUF2135 domain-containing protein [Cellvibrionaceae bacterium]